MKDSHGRRSAFMINPFFQEKPLRFWCFQGVEKRKGALRTKRLNKRSMRKSSNVALLLSMQLLDILSLIYFSPVLHFT